MPASHGRQPRHPARAGKGALSHRNGRKRGGLKPAAAAYQRELRVLQPGGRRRRLAHRLEQRGPQCAVIVSADTPDGGELLRHLLVALGKSIQEFKMVITDLRP